MKLVLLAATFWINQYWFVIHGQYTTTEIVSKHYFNAVKHLHGEAFGSQGYKAGGCRHLRWFKVKSQRLFIHVCDL